MGTLSINAFATQELAQAHFDNFITEDKGIDGIIIKAGLRAEFSTASGQSGWFDDAAKRFIVISFPVGTALQIDTNDAAAATPAEEQEESTPEAGARAEPEVEGGEDV